MFKQIAALAMIGATLIIPSCTTTESALLGPDPSLVTITANAPAGFPATEGIQIVGSFRNAEPWAPGKGLDLKRQTDGTWKTVITPSQIESLKAGYTKEGVDFHFKFVASKAKAWGWDFEEKNATCGGIGDNRIIQPASAGGKAFTYTIAKFGGYGC